MKRLKLLRAFTKFLRNNDYLGSPPKNMTLGYVGEYIEEADKGKNIIDSRLFYVRYKEEGYFTGSIKHIKDKSIPIFTDSRLEAAIFTYEETQKYVASNIVFEEINTRDHNNMILTYIKLIASNIIYN